MLRPVPRIVLVMCAVLAAAGVPSLRAQDAFVLEGVVRAEGTDAPLAGARVDVSRDGRPLGRSISAQNGRFAIPLAGDDDLVVAVTKAGYAPFRAAAGPGQPLDLRLTAGAVITGRAIDTSGRPVADVTVRVRRAATDGVAAGPWMTALTNDLGEYRIGSLPAGSYEVALHPASILTAQLGGLAASGMSPGRLPALLAGTPDQVPGMPAAAMVELRPGRETVHDLIRPEAPATTPQAGAGSAAAQRAALANVRTQLGAPPVDPSTAGRVTGVVMGPDGRPVPAMVRLQPQDGAPPHMALADASGRYEFEAVPPGAYRVIARAVGTMEAEHGAAGITRTGAWVAVRERQRVERIDIDLPRAGVASGRIVDAFGEPLEGLTVDAWQALTYAGRPVLQPAVSASSATTDDRGQYRLHGLMPGRYYIIASESAASVPGLPPAGGGAQALQSALASVLAIVSTPPRPHSYYPGRPASQEASPIIVDVGVDALGLDMTFVPARGVPVSGVVLGPDGTPIAALVTLSVSRRSGTPLLPPYRTTAGADGAFSFPNVVPGEYVLQAEGDRAGGLSFVSAIVAAGAGMGGLPGVTVTGAGATTDALSLILGGQAWTTAGAPPAFATAFVVVTGVDLPPVTLIATTGSALSGRLTFEGPRQPPAPTAFALGFAPADTDLARGMVPAARATADGTFEASGLIGPMRLMAARTPEGWWLKSAIIDGVNAVDQPVTFGSASRTDVDVVFSSVQSAVEGRVLDRSGDPATAAMVLAFPTDWTRWYGGTPFVRQAPVASGQFEIAALTPGAYYVVAVDAAAAAAVVEAQDPEQLNRLLPFARQVVVREGGVQRAELRVADVPR
jgi:protocatechuate 3,4-dioxygenase beta subunit